MGAQGRLGSETAENVLSDQSRAIVPLVVQQRVVKTTGRWIPLSYVAAVVASPGLATGGTSGMACGSSVLHNWRATSRNLCPCCLQVTMMLAKILCTNAPNSVLLQPPIFRVITAGRSIRSAC